MSVKAILLFHLRVGGRLAIQSFIPLFSAIIVVIMLQIDYAGFVAVIARQIFGRPPSTGTFVLLACLAFAFPAWAAPRMAHGLNSWIRHLPISSSNNRRGLAFALIVVQAPLAVALGILAFVASGRGIAVFRPILLRILLLMVGAALAALPVKNRWVSGPISLAGALLALFGQTWMLLPALMLLLLVDALAGPIKEARAHKPWSAAGASFGFRVAWRALGWRMLGCYLVALFPLGFAVLFIGNNELSGGFLSGTARFAGSMAMVLFLSILSEKLSVRRPVWPWARSLAWSSLRRVLDDAYFLAAHALVLLVLCALVHIESAILLLLVLPLLAVRAAGHMRRMPERRTGNGPFLLEGFFVSGIIALIPWTALFALAAAPMALFAARDTDSRQKVTRWLEKHHDAGGDSLSWSA